MNLQSARAEWERLDILGNIVIFPEVEKFISIKDKLQPKSSSMFIIFILRSNPAKCMFGKSRIYAYTSMCV